MDVDLVEEFSLPPPFHPHSLSGSPKSPLKSSRGAGEEAISQQKGANDRLSRSWIPPIGGIQKAELRQKKARNDIETLIGHKGHRRSFALDTAASSLGKGPVQIDSHTFRW